MSMGVLGLWVANSSCRKPTAPPVVKKDSITKTLTNTWVQNVYDVNNQKILKTNVIEDKTTITFQSLNQIYVSSENLGEILCEIVSFGQEYIEINVPSQPSKFKSTDGKTLYWNLFSQTNHPRIYSNNKLENMRLKLTTDPEGKTPILMDYQLQ